MPKYQRNRIYSLIVGKGDEAVEINNLQIKFKVEKTSNNKDKKNNAYVKIYNLSDDQRRRLEEEYVQVILSVGYSDTGLINLFQGQINNIYNTRLEPFNTVRQGTNLITTLNVDELFTQLNMSAVNKIIPAGRTVKDVILGLIEDIPEITRQEMNGTAIEQQVPNGYPISGTPRQVLDKLSRDYDLEWQIDAGVLYISDVEGTFSDAKEGVFSIGQTSGLVDRPEYINEEAKRLRRTAQGKNPKKLVRKNAIKLKILLNPAIIAGSIIYLDFENVSGYYKVDEVIHEGGFRDNEWYSTLRCTEKID